MKKVLIMFFLFLPLFVSCGPANIHISDSVKTTTAPFDIASITPTTSEAALELTPVSSPHSAVYDESVEVVHIQGDNFFPVYYIKVHEYSRENEYEAEILGVYYQDRFIPWKAITIGDEAQYIVELLEKGDQASDLQSILVERGDKVRICAIDGIIVNTEVKENPSTYRDEGALFLFTTLSLGDRTERLPVGHYIGIAGDWNPMPREFTETHSYGSLQVDLDGNGAQDFLQIGTYLHAEYNVEYLTFSIVLNDVEIMINDMPDTFAPSNTFPTMDAYFFPIDVNGDGIYEVFLIAQTRDPFNVFMYSLDNDIGAAKLKYSSPP